MKALTGCFIGLVVSVSASAEPLLEGRVRLESGEPVADAQVKLFDMADLQRGAVVRATTDGTGYFALPLAALTGGGLPEGFTLGQNYPNPFNPSTIIPYQLAASSSVRLEVFNLLGQRIKTLVDGERPAGFHTATWNATDAIGRAVGAGVYIYRMTVGVEHQSGRMVLIDGQAGVPAAGVASGLSDESNGDGPAGEGSEVYGLSVSGSGLAPYMDPAFRVRAGMAPVELVVSAAFQPASKAADSDAEVDIPDANLRAAIAAALGKESGAPITRAEMATLTTLGVRNADISDLTGLEFAINLTWLGLGHNAIADVSPLVSLTNLTGLELKDNRIADVSPLSGLTNLGTLLLSSNTIMDVSPLSGLTNLTWLDLLDNRIADVSPLSGLTNLGTLLLSSNTIMDVSPLSGLTNLTWLDLLDNRIADVSPLSGLTNLIALALGNNAIADVSPLSGLINLAGLALSDNAIADVSPLSGLINLTGLGLGSNTIVDVSPLSGLTNLTWLDLSDNAIADVSPLSGLINLTGLLLSDNGITDFSPLSGLTNLTGLGLDDTLIPDANLRRAIAAALGNTVSMGGMIVNMKALTELNASGVGISDLTGLEFATNLTSLNLSINSITDVSPLSGLTNLTELDLRGNGITDVSPLSGLTNLIELDLRGNAIADVSPLSGLTNLRELHLDDTLISDVNLRATIAAALGKKRGELVSAAEMEALTRLDAYKAGISDLTGLEFATNLTWLNLEVNAIADVSPLLGLTHLTTLYLGHNGIADVSPLSGLTNLTGLELKDNAIADVSPLSGLTNLTGLGLGSNTISDLSALSGLTNLLALNLSINRIADVSPLVGLTNLRELDLSFNAIADVSPLVGLTKLRLGELDLRGNTLNASSINDHIAALERSGVTVHFDPPLRESDFDIELVFLDDHLTEPHKLIIRYAARRWMSIIREDLPDYTFSRGWSGKCGDPSFTISSGERIDDLRIYVTVRELPEARAYIGGVEERFKPAAQAALHVWRETHLPVLGCIEFDLPYILGPIEPRSFLSVSLHEMGHVLGIGTTWFESGFLQDSSDDPHFNGPLAIAAFDDAGGRNYTGAKVPVEPDGWHWRFPGELMGGGGPLSAITIQALADLGYVVDVTQADPYTLPSAAQVSAKVAATHAESELLCGVGQEREPIYVVDEQGYVIRIIGD